MSLPFIVRWKRPRKVVKEQQLVRVPADSAPTAQDFTSWKLVESNKRGFTFKLQYVTLNEYPVTPSALTAQGFPSWKTVRTNKVSFTCKLQNLPELDKWTPVTTSGGVGDLIPSFITKWLRARKVVDLLGAPVFPPPPVIKTAQGFPSWELYSSNPFDFSFKLQTVKLNERHYTPDRYPAWKDVETNKVFFNIFSQEVELDQYTSTPATNSSEEYPSWLDNVDSFSISFGIDRKDTLEIDASPAPPLIVGGVGNLIPSFITKWHRARKSVDVLSIAPFALTPPAKTSQEYPSWLEIESFNIEFSLGRVPFPQASSKDTVLSSSAFESVVSYRSKFRRKHILGDVLLEYTTTLINTAQEYPSWEPVDTTKINFSVISQETVLNEYPVTPDLAGAEEYPSWLETESYTVDFKLRRVVELTSSSSSFVTPDTEVTTLNKIFRVSFKRNKVIGDAQLEYPVTPSALTAFLPHFNKTRNNTNRKFLLIDALDQYTESPFPNGGVRNAAEFFPTGQSDVTITLYDPLDDSVVALDLNNCGEILTTGIYVWNQAKITTVPTPYKEYSYIMTDGVTSESGMVEYNDFLVQYIIHEQFGI